jgi:mono/diheme cytochrome c family protein
VIAAIAAVGASVAVAAEKPVALKQAPGVDKVESNCAACHSLDYIQMNSPFPSPATWEAEVAKMVKTYGAPIDEEDAKAIVNYLKRNYGTEGNAPAAR